ncbi:MAG: gephyrin-like molybdotransferase Glp [Pedobacter sp.]
MINVAEAKAAILLSVKLPKPVTMPLLKALGHVLAKDIFASIDIPAFKQSSMDGYAIKFEDHEVPLLIKGEMAAGTDVTFKINSGETARIFTGAPLPEGADTVVMQEKVSLGHGSVSIQDPLLKVGANTREKGSEVRAGALAIQKNSLLTPAALGFIAGIGETVVTVYPMPKVSVILTGRELQAPGNPLGPGQVYESNSFSLRGALFQAGIHDVQLFTAEDDLLKLKAILSKAMEISDVVLLTGGVSVGDYDFVVEAAALCGVKQVFHKVKQKPGKPLYFGVLGDKLVFGLPGNPSSVLNCYYQYVLPAIEAISGKTVTDRFATAVMQKAYEKGAGLTHFIKAVFDGGMVSPLTAQESFRMSSFAAANCMICLDEEKTHFKEGEAVKVYMLPL